MKGREKSRQQFNRDNIAAAAKKLFETKGIDATTVDDIARKAQYSKSTMYVYFHGKEDILQYILLEQMILLKEMIAKVTKLNLEFQETYFALCREMVKYQKKYPVYFDLLLKEIQISQKDLEEENTCALIYNVGEEINDIILSLLKSAVEKKEVRGDIAIYPAVFYLWSGISQVIRFATEKEKYFQFRWGMKKEEYMEYGFGLLLDSVKGR